ncbi:DUF423 domain-containing protein [Sphingomonas abietis]|uniref:DUF423 domain-containing protein n=1 Tax=Sphingomonas abietis TaxID=3012344 RepID=A0ABY7NI43_9SPHN|nr:DUF423 domain-containing protein [Sphingomonas abietis]WBO21191.1 DUF423 domain-containing protein [Sphingomonas abietis]
MSVGADPHERRTLGVLASLSGAVAVVAGAYGAHGASGVAAEWLKTGSHYQLIHAVAALVAIGRPAGRLAGWCFIGGGGLFAATLYAMAFGAPHWLGAVTPLGGMGLIIGWLALAVGAGRSR